MPNELIPIVLFISTAAVLIFRPLTTRIGKVIERSHDEKKAVPEAQIQRIMQLMERLIDRMDRLEDRVDFTERMLERQRVQAQLTDGPARPEAERRYHEGRERGNDPL
ncbi:MAG: hypothetical protein PVJ43_09060 [Gemmatimonadales bacterium]|jgi:hypothetical protein